MMTVLSTQSPDILESEWGTSTAMPATFYMTRERISIYFPAKSRAELQTLKTE